MVRSVPPPSFEVACCSPESAATFARMFGLHVRPCSPGRFPQHDIGASGPAPARPAFEAMGARAMPGHDDERFSGEILKSRGLDRARGISPARHACQVYGGRVNSGIWLCREVLTLLWVTQGEATADLSERSRHLD